MASALALPEAISRIFFADMIVPMPIVSAFVGRVFRREAALFERHPEVNVDKTLDELDRMLSLEEAWTNEYPLQGEGKNGVTKES